VPTEPYSVRVWSQEYELIGALEQQSNDGPNDRLTYSGVISKDGQSCFRVKAQGRPSKLFRLVSSEDQPLQMDGTGLSGDPIVAEKFRQLTDEAVSRIISEGYVSEEGSPMLLFLVDLESGSITHDT
jgi:hypothetical protein